MTTWCVSDEAWEGWRGVNSNPGQTAALGQHSRGQTCCGPACGKSSPWLQEIPLSRTCSVAILKPQDMVLIINPACQEGAGAREPAGLLRRALQRC